MVAVNTICTQHFKKWQATAITIAISFQAVNVFFMPQLTSYFISTYGTLGTFLLLGAVTLNAFPAALALRSPPWVHTKSFKEPVSVNLPVIEPKITQDNGEDSQESLDCIEKENILFVVHDASLTARKEKSIGLKEDEKTFRNGSYNALKNTLKLLSSIKFHVNAFSFAVQMYVLTTFIIIHVDLARDKNIELGSGVYLMHSFTIGDILFRVVGGLLVDRRVAALETVVMLSFVGCAIACEGFIWLSSLLPLLLLSSLLGASQGLIVSLPSIVLLHDFKDQPLPMMFGTLRFIGGLLLMTRPPLLGKSFLDSVPPFSRVY